MRVGLIFLDEETLRLLHSTGRKAKAGLATLLLLFYFPMY